MVYTRCAFLTDITGKHTCICLLKLVVSLSLSSLWCTDTQILLYPQPEGNWHQVLIFDDATTLLRWRMHIRLSTTTQEKGEYEKQLVIIVTWKEKKGFGGKRKTREPGKCITPVNCSWQKKASCKRNMSLTQYFAIVLNAINYFTNDVWF